MKLVYYAIEYNAIFMSAKIDACFFSLMQGVHWDKIEILGEL